MHTSLPLQRRQFLLKMATSLGAVTGLASVARASVASVADDHRQLLDRLVSPSQAVHHIVRADGYVYVRGTGLPEHPTGPFPNPHCPGPILAQNHNFRLAAEPGSAAGPTPLRGWIFGVAINGVVFDPTGPFFYRDANTPTSYEFEVLTNTARPALGLDTNNAHTQPSGEYHYHGMPYGLMWGLQRARTGRGESDRMLLLGWAADGFPVYAPNAPQDPMDAASPLVPIRSSYVLRSGPRDGADSPGGRYDDHVDGVFVQDFAYVSGAGELDDCNGRYGVTPEYPTGTYHYFVTTDFPFIPRQWRGTPDPSFWHPSPGYDAVPPELRNLTF